MLKRQDEMEKQHFSIASKWTTVYFYRIRFIISILNLLRRF